MKFRTDRLSLLLLALCSTLSFSEAVAQTSDPTLRLPGESADSITGGMPSVMIRRTVKKDRRFAAQHSLSIDFLKTFCYTNVVYHYTLSGAFTVGGKIQSPPGLLGFTAGEFPFGIGGELKYFLTADGPKGFHLTLGAMFYVGNYTYSEYNENTSMDDKLEDTFSATSATLDAGWQFIVLDPFSITLMFGVERFLTPTDDIKEGILFVVNYPGKPYAVHGGLRVGYNW